MDSKVTLEEYVKTFAALGYDGFMICDHNSYNGCRAWDEMKLDPHSFVNQHPEYQDFTVLRGMEYDTKDAGHVLVVLPDGVYPPVLHIRGMKLHRLILLVHKLGGVLGPAHPYGVATASMMGFRNKNLEWLRHIDFAEVFNTCELPDSNLLAHYLAEAFDLPGIAGSDSHVPDYLGMAWTEIDADIHSNNDFIETIKNRVPISAGGVERELTKKGEYKENWFGRSAYLIYNRGIAKLRSPRRGIHHIRLKRKHHHTKPLLQRRGKNKIEWRKPAVIKKEKRRRFK